MIRFASVERILCNALHIDARTWDQSISAVVHGSTSVKRLAARRQDRGNLGLTAWSHKLQAASNKRLTAGEG